MDNKKALKRVSLDFTVYLIEQIDSNCEKSFITRRK